MAGYFGSKEEGTLTQTGQWKKLKKKTRNEILKDEQELRRVDQALQG